LTVVYICERYRAYEDVSLSVTWRAYLKAGRRRSVGVYEKMTDRKPMHRFFCRLGHALVRQLIRPAEAAYRGGGNDPSNLPFTAGGYAYCRQDRSKAERNSANA